ncbi:c-type cytochrome [Magnetococcales bacterium HHB-1]
MTINKKYIVYGLSIGLIATLSILAKVYYGDHIQEKKHASQSQAQGERLATEGSDSVTACSSCHGEKGEGEFESGYPRLAGLDDHYIIKQLQDFKRESTHTRPLIPTVSRDYRRTPDLYEDLTIFSPGIRNDEMMTEIARTLSETDEKNLAAYYSQQSFTASPKPQDYLTLQRGADLALRGKPEYRVPACKSCHGPDGEGFGQHFPPLTGQPTAYFIAQINRWQSGHRDNDNLSLMKNIANQLTDADKINAASYYSNRSYQVNVE